MNFTIINDVLTVYPDPVFGKPSVVRMWTAQTPTRGRDWRMVAINQYGNTRYRPVFWNAVALPEQNGQFIAKVNMPSTGYMGVYCAIVYPFTLNGIAFEYHQTTDLMVVPNNYPYTYCDDCSQNLV